MGERTKPVTTREPLGPPRLQIPKPRRLRRRKAITPEEACSSEDLAGILWLLKKKKKTYFLPH